MPQLSRALASEPLLAAHLLGPLCAVISGHRSTRLHHEIPALRKPSSSSSRKSPLTARYQPLVYSRIVGNPYLGIISGLPVNRECMKVVAPKINARDSLVFNVLLSLACRHHCLTCTMRFRDRSAVAASVACSRLTWRYDSFFPSESCGLDSLVSLDWRRPRCVIFS